MWWSAGRWLAGRGRPADPSVTAVTINSAGMTTFPYSLSSFWVASAASAESQLPACTFGLRCCRGWL